MFGFDGSAAGLRRKVDLSGKKKERKEDFLERTRKERLEREFQLKRLRAATKIQVHSNCSCK